MTKLSIVEFYVAKIESYMRRKHESILKVEEAQQQPIEEEQKVESTQRSSESHTSTDDFIVKQEQIKSYETEAESDLDADLDFYDRI